MNFSDERSTVKLNIYKPDHVIIIWFLGESLSGKTWTELIYVRDNGILCYYFQTYYLLDIIRYKSRF